VLLATRFGTSIRSCAPQSSARLNSAREASVASLGPQLESAVREFVRIAVACLSAAPMDQVPEAESRWERGSDGHFRERITRLRRLPLAIERSLEALPQYKSCTQLLESDAVIGAQINRLVGTGTSAARLETDNILKSLIYAMLDDNGVLRFDDGRFDAQWRRQVEFFRADQFAYKTIAPLPNLVVTNPPLPLNNELALDKLTDEEVTRCFQVGVLRPLSPRFPLISAEEAVGIRVTKLVSKVVRTDSTLGDLSYTVDAGTFGDRPHMDAQLIVDDVLSALHLFKHSRVRVAGHASWPDSWWLSSGTSYRGLRQWPYGSNYELTELERPSFLELWRQLEKWAAEFAFSIRRFNLAFDRDLLEDRIVDLVVAAESLLLGYHDVQDRGELRFRFALHAAKFIEHPTYGERDVYRIMRRAYDARSSVVHGGSPRDTRLPNNNVATMSEFTDEVEELVRLALRKALSMNEKGKSLHQSTFWEDLVLG
jgi:hypothetical protein